jgi:hypothetical protein
MTHPPTVINLAHSGRDHHTEAIFPTSTVHIRGGAEAPQEFKLTPRYLYGNQTRKVLVEQEQEQEQEAWQLVTRKGKTKKNSTNQSRSSSSRRSRFRFLQAATPGPNKANESVTTTKSGKNTHTNDPGSGMVAKAIKPTDIAPKKAIEVATTVEAVKGFVYGYCGKLEASNTEESFLRAALLLTGQYPADKMKPTWMFDVDCPGKTPKQKLIITVVPENWSNIFLNAVLPCLRKDQPWELFVRRHGSVSSTLEPPLSLKNVIRLNLKGRGTAYWKIPSDHDTLANCGINQIQPGFVRAMRLLCYDEPRPKDKLYVRGFCLGVDGLECVELKFWDLIKSDLENNATSHLYDITFGPLGNSSDGKPCTVIRMTGNNFISTVGHQDVGGMAKEILNMSEKCLRDKTLPVSFRIWENSQAREKNLPSEVIRYAEIEKASHALKTRFKDGWPLSHTVWFRPEWETFLLHDIEAPEHTTMWDCRADRSLQSFKKALSVLWSNPMSYNSFRITEMPSISGRDVRFIITNDTTEDDWRLYVYDWLQSNHLAVKRNVNINYGEQLCHI